jgi:hypothetical protein
MTRWRSGQWQPITVTEADRHELGRLPRSSSIQAGLSRRAPAMPPMAAGFSGVGHEAGRGGGRA